MSQFILNGKAADSISLMDRGLHYGDGLFETIACDSGKLLLWPQHLQRLQAGAERLALPLIPEQQWLDDVRQLSFEQPQAVVKLIQTRGIGGRGYYAGKLTPTWIAAAYPWPAYPQSNAQGVRLRFCQTPVSVNAALAGLKHLNRLDNVLARNEWDDPAIAEGLMLDDRGMVIEGTMSNVFGVKAGVLYTPDVKRAGVAGVVRDEILDLARHQGLDARRMDISQHVLLAMDELFISNSVIGIWPVIQLDAHRWPQGPVTQMLKEILIREMFSNATKI
ncbi:MAG: aminodeoxychorismate lyase [Gammaproteobacteria bacterium]|nr:aminodeoxychorismate lyase [Gammaproteobacteria bacterium]